VRIGANLSRREVMVFEDVGFQLQQREVFSPCRIFSMIATLRIIWTNFPSVHPTYRFGKIARRNLATPMANHKKIWENAKLMDDYYVVRITAILYSKFGVLISIFSKEYIAYRVTIGNIPLYTCPNFTKTSSQSLGRKEI
jgi:hypothetical protein